MKAAIPPIRLLLVPINSSSFVSHQFDVMAKDTAMKDMPRYCLIFIFLLVKESFILVCVY